MNNPSDQSALRPSSIAAIVPAAGSGRRFGATRNKLFAPLGDRPLWYHAIVRLRAHSMISRIVMPTSPEDQMIFRNEYQPLIDELNVEIVTGGIDRTDSVRAGLAHLSSDPAVAMIAVHDAARPLVSHSDLDAVFVEAAEHGAAILACPVAGTVKRDLESGRRCETVDRRELWIAMTPQVFRTQVLADAYKRHNGRPATDDAQLVERAGYSVALVHGSADNLKITYPKTLPSPRRSCRDNPTMPEETISNQSLLDELRWRGLIHQCTDEVGLAKLLDSGQQTVYIGFDPTASSLHVGSMMQLMMLRRFQRAGHRPIALVGGATGMIGDPSGKSEERNLLSPQQLHENVSGVAAQMRRFLAFDGDNAALLLNNFDWMQGYSYLEFLRDIGKSFPVGAMMGKESVRSRLDSEAGLSYTEFSYMLLQAYDFVHLTKDHDCLIQAGGSDQWGNITAGIELGRRMLGKQLFGITAPLLTTSDGRKMGKTEQGAVWLAPERTSPYQFFQYWKNVADDDVMTCIAFLTEIDRAEYNDLAEATKSDPGRRTAQNRLAQWMTQLVHGDDGLENAERASRILFGGELGDQTDASLSEIFADVPSCELPRDRLTGDGYWIVQALQDAGLVKSGGEARRAIKDGGVYVNNARATDIDQRLNETDLASETVMVMRKGKRNYTLLRFR